MSSTQLYCIVKYVHSLCSTFACLYTIILYSVHNVYMHAYTQMYLICTQMIPASTLLPQIKVCFQLYIVRLIWGFPESAAICTKFWMQNFLVDTFGAVQSPAATN